MKTIIRITATLVCLAATQACTITDHTPRIQSMTTVSASEFRERLRVPAGPILFRKHNSADWVVDRTGLIHLDDPAAVAAGLESGDEPIQIYFYELRHPTRGAFLIDSGLSEKITSATDDYFPSLMQSAMNLERLKPDLTIEAWLHSSGQEIAGVFLTHMHMDHIMGLPGMAAKTPVYTGYRETTTRYFLNLLVRGPTDKVLGEEPNLVELKAGPDSNFQNGEPRIVDYFGDGSLFVIFVPGHTPGSLAFVVRSTTGAQLITGDTCHTVWGWKNGVTPGDFTQDHELNQVSLDWLIALKKEFPALQVHPGHQSL